MSDFIKAAVLGHPIQHSKSPIIHNYWMEQHGLKGSYEAIDVAPENLESEIRRLVDDGYTGFNLTIPHKEAVLDVCDHLDHASIAIGAVNTLAVKDGKIHGFNTDAFGFLANIKEAVPDFEFDLGPAVLLGAGGASRAIISGLIGMRVPEIIICNRTRDKAEHLANEMALGTEDLLRVVDWDERENVLHHANLVINATALGMEGQPELEMDLSELPSFALVTDIVYAPLETQLLKDAKENGNDTVTGIGMLLHQARPAFKEWFGIMPDVTPELQDLVLK